jgi:HAD superfamily hydrolase (TIGR01509 family)
MLQDVTCYLFDLDGTLVDSSPVHDRAYRHTLGREHPHLLPGFDYRAIAGLATRDAFRSLGLSESESRHCTLLKQSHYREAVAAGAVREMTGAKAMLAMLKARGASIGVVTSASRASALKTLQSTGLAQHVDIIVTADDVAQTKPAAVPYLAALAQMKADPAPTVAIEDSPSGIASARAAGLKVIGMHDETVRPLSDQYFADFAAFAGALA